MKIMIKSDPQSEERNWNEDVSGFIFYETSPVPIYHLVVVVSFETCRESDGLEDNTISRMEGMLDEELTSGVNID